MSHPPAAARSNPSVSHFDATDAWTSQYASALRPSLSPAEIHRLLNRQLEPHEVDWTPTLPPLVPHFLRHGLLTVIPFSVTEISASTHSTSGACFPIASFAASFFARPPTSAAVRVSTCAAFYDSEIAVTASSSPLCRSHSFPHWHSLCPRFSFSSLFVSFSFPFFSKLFSLFHFIPQILTFLLSRTFSFSALDSLLSSGPGPPFSSLSLFAYVCLPKAQT